jgi:hypothetical protein
LAGYCGEAEPPAVARGRSTCTRPGHSADCPYCPCPCTLLPGCRSDGVSDKNKSPYTNQVRFSVAWSSAGGTCGSKTENPTATSGYTVVTPSLALVKVRCTHSLCSPQTPLTGRLLLTPCLPACCSCLAPAQGLIACLFNPSLLPGRCSSAVAACPVATHVYLPEAATCVPAAHLLHPR